MGSLYIILSTTVSFLEDTILLSLGLLFYNFCVHFHFFRKFTLHVCYVFNVILMDSFDDRRSQCRLI